MAENCAFSATGNQMIAEAMRQINPDVMAAYPITPQTTIVETYAKYVANGQVTTEFVTVESEHSALSACIGASAAGARVATATASQGLALMWEELYIAAGMRTPIVMANANRALSAPINIHGDHSDVMGARDAGWVMFFAETAQEAYDNTIISFKVAEDPRVLLPTMTTLDGFITSHAMERCEKNEDDVVKAYVGDYSPKFPLLDVDNPVGHGMFAMGDCYMKSRYANRLALANSIEAIEEHGKAWAEICGRPFDVVDAWGMEDAEYAVVVLGSTAGNARYIARQLRAEGKKVGVIRPRVYRPFPAARIAEVCANVKALAVLDRADSLGAEVGPLAADTIAALYAANITIPVKNFVYGLGGVDVTNDQIKYVFESLENAEGGCASATLEFLGISE